MIKPPLFDKWNRALQGAYRKGYQCAESGGSLQDCPYQDKRKPSGKLTWSRSFICAWNDGFNDCVKVGNITQYYADRSNSGLAALAK